MVCNWLALMLKHFLLVERQVWHDWNCYWLSWFAVVLAPKHFYNEVLDTWFEILTSLRSNITYVSRSKCCNFYGQIKCYILQCCQHKWSGLVLHVFLQKFVFLLSCYMIHLHLEKQKKSILLETYSLHWTSHPIFFCRKPSTEVKSVTPKKKKHCNCRNSKCLKMWVLFFVSHTFSCIEQSKYKFVKIDIFYMLCAKW